MLYEMTIDKPIPHVYWLDSFITTLTKLVLPKHQVQWLSISISNTVDAFREKQARAVLLHLGAALLPAVTSAPYLPSPPVPTAPA